MSKGTLTINGKWLFSKLVLKMAYPNTELRTYMKKIWFSDDCEQDTASWEILGLFSFNWDTDTRRDAKKYTK